jgi:hypothetical protein
MTAMDLILDGDGKLEEWKDAMKEIPSTPKLLFLEHGMVSGLPSAMFAFEVDGTMHYKEVSGRLVAMVLSAILHKFPELKRYT